MVHRTILSIKVGENREIQTKIKRGIDLVFLFKKVY